MNGLTWEDGFFITAMFLVLLTGVWFSAHLTHDDHDKTREVIYENCSNQQQ